MNTVAEVEFILRELGVKPKDRILDVGCGTGRHALELARRGCRVTGIDLSAEMLAIAQAAAEAEGLAVRFIRGDAATVRLEGPFEHAFSVCEGAFSLLEAAGFRIRWLGGGTAGSWNKRPPALDEYELMAIAERPPVERRPADRQPPARA